MCATILADIFIPSQPFENQFDLTCMQIKWSLVTDFSLYHAAVLLTEIFILRLKPNKTKSIKIKGIIVKKYIKRLCQIC